MDDQAIVIDEKEMLDAVKMIMTKMEQNKKLQELALANGQDIKNSTQLSETAMENVIVATLCLLLAQKSNDERYPELVKQGLAKRQLKTEIINTYKNQANQLITRYKQTQ